MILNFVCKLWKCMTLPRSSPASKAKQRSLASASTSRSHDSDVKGFLYMFPLNHSECYENS